MPKDWIKVRTNLPKDPKVRAIARALHENSDFVRAIFPGPVEGMGVTGYVTLEAVTRVTVTSLIIFWSAANEFGEQHGDDVILRQCDRVTVDDMAGCPGLAKGMEGVGWLSVDEINKFVILPRFSTYNTLKEERLRQNNAERQARFRAKHKALRNDQSNALPNVTDNQNSNGRREVDEKRIEKTLKARNVACAGAGSKKASAYASRCGGSLQDLAQNEFVDRCYELAVDFGFVARGDRGKLIVFSAAEQALDPGNDFGLFVHLVTDPNGHKQINNSSEDGASIRIKKFYFNETRRRLPADQEAMRD